MRNNIINIVSKVTRVVQNKNVLFAKFSNNNNNVNNNEEKNKHR